MLLAAYSSIAQTATTTIVTAPCTANGVIAVNVTGFTPPLTYTYYFGMGGSISPIVHSAITSLTDTLFSWEGGDGYVTVLSGSSSYAYASYHSGPVSISLTGTPAYCPSLGTATATVTGGTPPYTYSWHTTTGTFAGTTNPLNAPAGTYYPVVTDNAGCYLDGRYTNDTPVFIYSVAPFTYTVNSTTAACTNGTAFATGLTGGTSPYSYLWSNGATTATITGLTIGNYSLAITDASGCTDYPHYVNVPQSPVLTVNTTPTPATCTNIDGAVICFGSGGTPPYTYLWSNAATTQSQTGIAPGSYYVTATDVNGCSGNGYAYIGISTPITVTYSTTASSCTAPTGTATLTITGGTSPYSIIWYTSPPQTGTTATALMSGTYSFQVTDNVGCVQTGSVYIPPVSVLTISAAITPATCTSATGGAALTVSGGTTPYTYSWSTGGTASAISAVATGNYSVTITDNAGCSVKKYPYIPIYSPIHISFSSTLASCIFTADGSITATATGGTSPYTYSWTYGGTTATVTGLLTGIYYVTVVDAVGCTTHDTVHLGYNASATSCYCTIEGTVYFDANGDCTQASTEPGINNIQIHCSGIGYTYSNAAGYYSFKVPTGTYTISQNILAYYPLSACQSNSISVTAAAATGCVHTVNFADTLNPIHDIHISTWDYTYAIPGNTYIQTTIVSNDGTITEPNILAGYKADGQVFSPSTIPSGVFNAGGSYWYNTAGTFPSVAAGASSAYFMSYNVPTNIPLGTSVLFKDTAAYSSPMSNWLTDYSPWNNVNYFTTTVIGSYDPNFKEVAPKGIGATGMITYNDSVLEYMVHFQNTGTWFAQNIVVIDTLDANLDWSTLRPVYHSHQCQVSVSETGVATFTFKNINLPAQYMDDLRSNGMFTYTIKTRHSLALGTQIKNKAAIYFDYNAPIFTNRTLNTIGSWESVPEINTTKNNSFTIYPNPAENSFNAVITSEINATYSLRVSDIAGKTMINKAIALQKGTQAINVDATLLSPGIYFVSITGADKVQTAKLVIIK